MKNYIKFGYLILISPILIWNFRDEIGYYLKNNVILGDPGRKSGK